MSTLLTTVHIDDARQADRNRIAAGNLDQLADWLERQPLRSDLWRNLAARADAADPETGECVSSLLPDLVPDTVERLADRMAVEEDPTLQPAMPLSALKALIEARYDWALAIDFDDPEQNHLFWYRSEEKEEPRLGVRTEEPGADREMALDIARQVQRCHRAVCAALERDGDQPVATFLLHRPDWRGIVRRIQTLGRCRYGDIRANLLHRDTLPIHLLRCKLSFLGAFRFDPRSDRWVRITLFQGAPLRDELDDAGLAEHWYPPVFPESA